MSSIDTHMQCSYQLSDPTVTAIVINPRDPGQIGSSREYGRGPEYSIYSLTEGGLQRVKNCKEKGFHHGCGDGDNYKVIFIRHRCISFLLLFRSFFQLSRLTLCYSRKSTVQCFGFSGLF